MEYRIENGRYEGVLLDGRVITFEDCNEMLAYAREREEIFKLIGRSINDIDEIKKLLNLSQPVKRLKPKKKKVCIRIDPDVEYLGNEKALA